MRLRPFVAISIAAAAAVLLAGCSGAADPKATPSASGSAATPTDLCSSIGTPGDLSNSIKVGGDQGKEATATFNKPLTIPGLQVTVVKKGTGTAPKSGDVINYGLTAFDATTGAKSGSVGYTAKDRASEQITTGSGIAQLFGCATVGTRTVATIPPSQSGGAQVYVLDVLGVDPLPDKAFAWGADKTPVKGLPTVKLDAKTHAPTITIPKSDPLKKTTVSVLKEGDGATVASGDNVWLQYAGVRWSTGAPFDSSWSRGLPTRLKTTQVVTGFQKALEGQKVGSQVLVVIPPADGYGAGKINTSDLKGETLVFVIDILKVTKDN